MWIMFGHCCSDCLWEKKKEREDTRIRTVHVCISCEWAYMYRCVQFDTRFCANACT